MSTAHPPTRPMPAITPEMLRDLVLRQPPERIPCLARDGELWFSPRMAEQRKAAALCGACPVTHTCRAAGRAIRAAYGVWGGETPSNRRRSEDAGRNAAR